MMEYKGYQAKVEFDDEANVLHGRVINTRDVITFQAQSVDELRKEFIDSVEDYLEFCAERGEEPEKPFSGRFVLRIDPSLHREIAIAASRTDESINTWITKVLQQAVHMRPQHVQATVYSEDVQRMVSKILSTTRTFAQGGVLPGSHLRSWSQVQGQFAESTLRTSLRMPSDAEFHTAANALDELFDEINEGRLNAS